jgi:sRNA-binding carbon storage regulator CsrA
MLILTRYVGQSFNIYLEDGSVINVILLDNQASQYGRFSKIGIDAPRHLNIVRTELLKRNTQRTIELLDDDCSPKNLVLP